MSAFCKPRTLSQLTIERVIYSMASFSDDELSVTLRPLSNLTLERIFKFMMISWDAARVEQALRFLRLFGRRFVTMRLDCNFRLFHSKTNPVDDSLVDQVVTTIADCLDQDGCRRLDLYDHPFLFTVEDCCRIIDKPNRLTSIRLLICHLDDRIIEKIARNCANLCVLKLYGMNFSDKALRMLASFSESLDNAPLETEAMACTGKQQSLGCRNLQQIYFFQGNSGFPGFSASCIADLLRQLEKLHTFYVQHYIICEAFVELMTANRITRLRLTTVSIDFSSEPLLRILTNNAAKIKQFANESGVPRKNNNCQAGSANDIRVIFLRAIAYLMPNLATLNITLQSASQLQQLCVLSQCTELTALEVTVEVHCVDHSDSMHDWELSLNKLLAVLPALKNLEMHNVPAIDANGIGLFCPQLESLHVTNLKQIRYLCHGCKTFDHFEHLKLLQIVCHTDALLNENCLVKLLLTSPQLEVLVVAWCDQLNDDLVRRVLQLNQMPRLKRLELIELSDQLTIEAVRQFAFSRSRSLFLNVTSCSGIEPEDMEALKQEIKAANQDVTLKYHYQT